MRCYLIGLCGYAQTGKDTVGQILAEEFGFARVSFAGPVKEHMELLNPYIGVRTLASPKRLSEALEDYGGWDGVKHHAPPEEKDEIRRLLQVYGTDLVRDRLNEDAWIDKGIMATWKLRGQNKSVVVTDVRFPNEGEKIRNVGSVWKIHRPGIGPERDHSSETMVDLVKADRDIHNNGTLAELKEKVIKLGHSYHF
jgi:hypothetical protein